MENDEVKTDEVEWGNVVLFILTIVAIVGILCALQYMDWLAYQNLETVDYNIIVVDKSWEKGLPKDLGFIETNCGTMVTDKFRLYSALAIGESYNVSTKTGYNCPKIVEVGR